MLRNVSHTVDHEFGCDQCFELMDFFADELRSGRYREVSNPHEHTDELALVQDHLEKCMDCHEMFHALLVAIKKTTKERG